MKKHEWKVSAKEAVVIQEDMRKEVKLVPLVKEIKYIAGCDVSMSLYSSTIYAGFVVMSYPDMRIVDHAVVKDETHFPYVPGLLSFREIPALLKAWELLKQKPDLVVVDGQGIAHPRRLGIASHLGVVLDIPTIGCGKSKLTGVFTPPKDVGETSVLLDPKTKEILGGVLLSKLRSNPLFISPGHLVTIPESIEIVKSCLQGYRLPEPTRMAHNIMNEYRKKETDSVALAQMKTADTLF